MNVVIAAVKTKNNGSHPPFQFNLHWLDFIIRYTQPQTANMIFRSPAESHLIVTSRQQNMFTILPVDLRLEKEVGNDSFYL